MPERSIIEIYRAGRWIPAAELVPMAGTRRATFEYLVEYVFGEDPQPISLTLPVSMERSGLGMAGEAPACPPYFLDLVPQGRGRTYLAQDLKLADAPETDLVLAQHGAHNPIGNLRFDTAVRYFEEHRIRFVEAGEGFTLEEIVARKEAFLEHVWMHAMLSAGTTGVQGAAPKFLLTEARSGRWYADAALADSEAKSHWLVKLPRGTHETDGLVLRNEAPYLHTAKACGLRVMEGAFVEQDMLFVPRFDRAVTGEGVERYHQESLAALAGHAEFGMRASLFDLVGAFAPHVADVAGEVAEFLKRELLNQALRNTDNHARNTAVQRLPGGRAQLTPLFDFAPMYLDREMIVRGCRWIGADKRERTDWAQIVEELPITAANQAKVMTALQRFAVVIEGLPEIMRAQGVDERVIEDCKPSIALQQERLAKLGHYHQEPQHGPTP